MKVSFFAIHVCAFWTEAYEVICRTEMMTIMRRGVETSLVLTHAWGRCWV